MAKRVIKLTESDIKMMVKKIIKEADGDFEFFGFQDAERLKNIANVRKTVDKDGIIRNPNSSLNGTRFADYISKFNVSDSDIAIADKWNKKVSADTAKQNERYKNIATIYNKVDAQGIIRFPGNQFDGTSWSSYLKRFSVTQQDLEAAKTYDTNLKTQNQNAKMANIVNILKTVDSNGIIKNPASKLNNTKWVDYVKRYNVTPQEIEQAKAQIGGKTPPPASDGKNQVTQRRQADPSVIKIQQDLKAKGYNLGTTGANRDGVDGIMGPRTRAALAAEKAKTTGTTTQPATGVQGDDTVVKKMVDDYIKRNPLKLTDLKSTLTPEQQKTLDDIKARYGNAGQTTVPPTNPS